MSFLDLQLKAYDNSVHTISFRKCTAGNTILHAKSCRLMHVLNNIPIVEMLRTRMNCSSLNHFLQESTNISNRLKCRKSPSWALKRAHNITIQKDRKRLLCPNVKHATSADNPVVFSTPHSVEFKDI